MDTPTLAMRLIFEYEGDQVRLVSQQPVDVAITGFDIARAQHPGWYVDTRDATGRALARVPARDAFSGGAEVFPEQHGEPITRVAVAKPRGRLYRCRACPGGRRPCGRRACGTGATRGGAPSQPCDQRRARKL